MSEAQEESTVIKYLTLIPKGQGAHYPSFYYQDDILMRVSRPPQLSNNDTWVKIHQVVLPSNLRKTIMEIAHEDFPGHVRIPRTCEKILSNFYWPGLKKDVASLVNTCHTCQTVGKVNQKVPHY